MIKRLTFLIFCLLMTTPYIIGGESAVRESETPNAHSMVRKTVRRKVRVVSAKADADFSLRQETLFVKGDEHFMPRASIDYETKKLYSLLPLEVDSFQTRTSRLAHFVRKTIWATGLSKSKTRIVVNQLFPSNSVIKREARRRGLTNEELKFEYLTRQVILHQYLSTKVHSQWATTFVDLKNSHLEKVKVLKEQIDELGGFINPHKEKIATINKEIQQIERTFAVKASKIDEIYQTISEWAAQGKTITDECVALPFVQSVDVGKFRVSLKKAASKEVDKKMAAYENDKQSMIESLNDEISSLNEDTEKHNSVVKGLVDKKAEQEKYADDYGYCHSRCSSVTEFAESDAPWMDRNWSHKVAQESYVLTMLEKAEQGKEDFAFLHHPELIWPCALNAGSLALMMGESISLRKGISIPRTNKPVFKGVTGLKERAGIANIRQLSEAIGLPTYIDNGSEFYKLNSDELWDQYNQSTIEFMHPTGVLAELGTEFNRFWNEGETFRRKWVGELYDFTAPTMQTHKEQQRAEKIKQMNQILSEFNFD